MSNLDLELQGLLGPEPTSHGASASYIRDLSDDDLKTLERPKPKAPAQTVLRIRDTHHALARLIAEGRRPEEISSITGYAPSYISTIRNDPAFSNLVSYYREITRESAAEATATLHERLNAISMLAAEEMMDRLTTRPEEFTRRELNEVISSTADRTGFGPSTKSTNLNIHVDLAPRLQAARKRMQEVAAPRALLTGPTRDSPQVCNESARPTSEIIDG